jgi:hypothetical protein
MDELGRAADEHGNRKRADIIEKKSSEVLVRRNMRSSGSTIGFCTS